MTIDEVLQEMRDSVFLSTLANEKTQKWADAIEAAMREKDEELDFLRSVKESRGRELAERDAEIDSLRTLLLEAKEIIRVLATESYPEPSHAVPFELVRRIDDLLVEPKP